MWDAESRALGHSDAGSVTAPPVCPWAKYAVSPNPLGVLTRQGPCTLRARLQAAWRWQQRGLCRDRRLLPD